MRASRIISIVILLGTLVCVKAQTQKPPLPLPSDCGRRNVIVYDGELSHLLATLSERYQTVIGFETVPHQLRRNIKVSACFTTLDDVLDLVAVAAPEYLWRRHDGLVEVLPKDSALPLLDSMISEFELNNADWAGAMQAVVNLIEAKSQLTNTHLSSSGPVSSSQHIRLPAIHFSLRLENITLRRILHEVTKKSENYFWTFQRTGKDGQTFSIKNYMI